MRALVWEGPHQMVLQEQPVPVPDPGEVVIEVRYAGICGSELSGYQGHNALRIPPLIMGHEFSGVISEIDPGVQAQRPDLAVGQAVTVNPLTSCGTCRFCKEGRNHLCTQRQLIGAHRPGAYAEFVSVPAQTVTVLPKGMPMRTGALVEPAAVAVRIGNFAGDLQKVDALIVGAGPIGLLALQVFHLLGAERVWISDIDPARLAIAAQLGGLAVNPRDQDLIAHVRAETGGLGVAVSVDAVGTAQTRAQCVAGTQSGGTLILSGLHEETSPMPAAEIIRRELRVWGSFAYAPADFDQALRLLQQNRLRLDPWIAEDPLEQGQAWFERLCSAPGDVTKVLLTPQ